MRIAAIIVTYRTPPQELYNFKKNLFSFLPSIHLEIVDNTIKNIGYGAAINIGIKKAIEKKFDTFLVLNTDIQFTSISSRLIEEGLKKYDILGGAFFQNGLSYLGGKIDKLRLSGYLNKETSGKKVQHTSSDFISGSCMIATKKTFEKIGMFDEHYFMYYEDVEICARARKKGLKIGISNRIRYVHFERRSQSFKKFLWLKVNRFRFFINYSNKRQKLHELIRFPKTVLENTLAIFHLLRKSYFLSNFFTLNIISLIIKLLSFVYFFVLIRGLNINDYGIYTYIWNYISIFSSLVDFGSTSYGLLLVNEKDKKHFSNLFSFRLVNSLIILIIANIIFLSLKNESNIRLYLLFASFVFISNSIYGSLIILCSITKKLFISSIISLVFNISNLILLFIILKIGKGLTPIFIGIFILYFLYTLWCFYKIQKLSKVNFRITFQLWKEFARKSSIFVVIALFAGLYNKVDIILLGNLKSASDVGVYSAGYKIYEAIMFVIPTYNLMVQPTFSNLARSNILKLKYLVKIHSLFLLFLSLFVVVIIFLTPSFIYSYIYKSEYFNSIKVLKIVTLAFPLICIHSIFLNVIYAFRKYKSIVFLYVFQTVISLTLNMLFIPHFSFYASSWITVINEVFNFGITGIFVYYLFKKNEHIT
jgi:O-antigen/teichoic acid export membrane protein